MSKQRKSVINSSEFDRGGKTIIFAQPLTLDEEKRKSLEDAKEELLNRYVYLHANREVILAPYLDTTYNLGFNYEKFDELTSMIEEFLLSEKPFEESEFYKYIESKKADSEFMRIVNQKLEEADNNAQKIYLSMWKIFENLKIYILKREANFNPTCDSISVEEVLDQYYILLRFEISKAGVEIPGLYEAGDEMFIGAHFGFINPEKDSGPGTIKENTFMTAISEASTYFGTHPTYSIFTIPELIQIYLQYPKHDMYSYSIVCPECEKEMTLVPYPRGMFIHTDPETKKSYQICPHCNRPQTLSDEVIRDLFPLDQPAKPQKRALSPRNSQQ